MNNFRIERDLTPLLFAEHAVWSEYYDFEELEEIRSWGIEEKFIDELLKIAKEGGDHPYYPVPLDEVIPDRMRIFIYTKFKTLNGYELEGVICNPDPFVIGIFVDDEIVIFNPNLLEFWQKSESIVKKHFGIESFELFPMNYETPYQDCDGNSVKGSYNKRGNV
ncbi:MAG TPA: hypothetical protein PK055_00915 [Gammaproteobacteria bacterium]|nr:hypothetical protein [Xanthomonadales bacterium]HPI94929.1 hypothetical protein [Gammaproteobacteria bacterium]HPQ86195.1 hypothetical protein [Gammaproteobacteria bacterium]